MSTGDIMCNKHGMVICACTEITSAFKPTTNPNETGSKLVDELKPCPFCGKKGTLEDSANVTLCCISGYWYLDIERWNNAWAHKRIAELEKENEGLKAIAQLCCNEKNDYKIAALEREVATMKRQREIENECKAPGGS